MSHQAAARHAEDLRREFDAGFAHAANDSVVRHEGVLEIDLDGTRCGIRLSEIAGLFSGVVITPLPTSVPELLGIGSSRGAILPVYDLAAIVGFRADERTAHESRWLVTANAAFVGLAFRSFEGHLRVETDSVLPYTSGDTASSHVHEGVRTGNRTLPIVSLRSVLAAISVLASEPHDPSATRSRSIR